jgi:(p)ppGpp synthase/HD superfamily hydrolase
VANGITGARTRTRAVVDDAHIGLSVVRQRFGDAVADNVDRVSKLSQMNQLLRRGRRQGWTEASTEHFRQLRKLIVDLSFQVCAAGSWSPEC